MADAAKAYQIKALTATRAIAAILVFIHHFGTAVFPFNLAPYFFGSGNIAVGYFFVLSGFVLYISYAGKDLRYRDYIKKRIARIIPIYELALLLAIFVAVSFFNYNIFSWQSVKEIFYSTFFIQSFIPSYPLVLNGPGWTISIEMFFYALFPLLLWLQHKSLKGFVVLTIAFFLVSQYFHLKYFPQRHSLGDNIVDTIFFSPEIHLSQFLIGMTGGYLFNVIKNTSSKYKMLPFLLFACIVILIAYRPESISYQVGLISPLFMLLIISIAIYQPKSLGFGPLVFLGEISYGIYILQQPVYKFLSALNAGHFHILPAFFFWFSLSVLILVASLSYFFVELPLRKKIGSSSFGKVAKV